MYTLIMSRHCFFSRPVAVQRVALGFEVGERASEQVSERVSEWGQEEALQQTTKEGDKPD